MVEWVDCGKLYSTLFNFIRSKHLQCEPDAYLLEAVIKVIGNVH